MTRPKYESEKHRENERRIITEICNFYPYNFREMPLFHTYDFDLTVPNPLIQGDFSRVAITEVKWRSGLSAGKYPEYWISQKKILFCLSYSEYYEKPFYLVVEFTEGIYITAAIKWSDFRSWKIRRGGRTDRDDPKDLEDMVLIPLGKFKPYREV